MERNNRPHLKLLKGRRPELDREISEPDRLNKQHLGVIRQAAINPGSVPVEETEAALRRLFDYLERT